MFLVLWLALLGAGAAPPRGQHTMPQQEGETPAHIPELDALAQTPLLHLNTGMHTAAILKLGVDAANRYLATGSLDKTIRVWELGTGRTCLVVTLRRQGMRVYRTQDYTQVASDSAYGDRSTWADFDSSGRPVTSTLDGPLSRAHRGRGTRQRAQTLVQGRLGGRRPDALCRRLASWRTRQPDPVLGGPG